jgi:hypothetical protein
MNHSLPVLNAHAMDHREIFNSERPALYSVKANGRNWQDARHRQVISQFPKP